MSAFPLEHRVLRSMDTRKLYQQTLEHFLISVSTRNSVFFQRNMDDYSSYSIQQRSLHVWSAALP